MAEYKKNPGFNKNRSRTPGRDFGDRPQLHKAECSSCHAVCEVPFRPNGKKPIFCQNCYKREEGSNTRPERGSFQKNPYSAPHASPARFESKPDPRIDTLVVRVAALEAKLDTLIAMLAPSRMHEAPAAKAPVEKVAKAPAKKPAKKAAAKKSK